MLGLREIPEQEPCCAHLIIEEIRKAEDAALVIETSSDHIRYHVTPDFEVRIGLILTQASHEPC